MTEKDKIQPNFLPLNTLKDRILSLAEKCTTTLLCEVNDLKIISRIGKLQLYIAKQDHQPMDINLCAKVNQEFCKLLEVYEPHIRIKFTIEVLSAGLDRPLKTPEIIQKHINQRISMSYMVDNKQFYGTFFIIDATDELTVIPENQIQSVLKNTNLKKTLGKYANQNNITFNQLTYIEQAKLILELRQILDIDVAKVNNLLYLENFKEKLSPIVLKYDNILKVRLAPHFE